MSQLQRFAVPESHEQDADQFARCAVCWRWFDRGDPVALAGHRGPLPHAVAPRCTAWADKDE